MFNRPRCRDWTALATQQLRLRNLIRIIGHNICCSRECQLYFTLHSSAMSAPFFTSEKVTFHGSGNVEWSEITSQAVLKSTARCVCIRVWEHNAKTIEESQHNSEVYNAAVSDRMLFVWGVYFSGLVSVTRRADITFLCNSLTFQMHGGYFASPETITVESIRQQLSINYAREQCENLANICSCNRIHTEDKEPALDNEINCEKLRDRVKQQPCNNSERRFEINSPRCSRNCSPVREEDSKRFSCVALSRDMLQMLRTRYLEKGFLNSEIRPSYSLDKLLYLQEKQRKYKQKNEHAKEISEKICMKSAFCLNLELISSKRYYNQRRGNLSMGRTLNRLLFEEPCVKPEDILRGQELRRQIEQACFRCQLLSREKDKMRSQFRNLEKKLGQIHDQNIEQESSLMSCYRKLNQEKECLMQEKAAVLEQRGLLFRTQTTLRRRRMFLCKELQKIYPISRVENGLFTINSILLPNSDHLLNDAKLTNANYQAEAPTPISLSVALGYVSHVVHMCCVIYDIPPRNPIKHEGSRSRILDVIKDIPNSSREFPLYCRTSPLPKPIFYAIYLLNQNIAQLNFQIYSIKCDTRETLLNLLWLLNGTASSLPDLMLSAGIGNHDLSTSGSSVDLNVSVPSISKSVDIINRKVCEERLSRSVGSYREEQMPSEKSFRNSEPILSLQQKTYLSEFNENCDI